MAEYTDDDVVRLTGMLRDSGQPVDTAGTGRRTVMVGGKVTAKPPTPDPERSIFYPDAGGGLHRDDPYQTRAFDPTTGEPTA